MKKFFLAVCALAALYGCAKEKPADRQEAGRITISGAWALYPMVVKWADEYQKKNPGVIIDVSAGGAGKGMADALNRAADLGMVSRDINKSEIEKGAWWMSAVKDAVVPTISERNPFRDGLLKRGLTKREFAEIWLTGKLADWSAVAAGKKKAPIHVYTRSDACGAAETWARFAGGSQEDLRGVGVYGDPGLADAVRGDALGIGYNNVNFAYDAKTKKPVAGITVLPLDVNGNGKIDPDENFYADRDSLIKAIAGNKYPSPPARNLHLVSRGVPEKKQVLLFLLWVLGEGQRYVPESGYIMLPGEQLKKQADELQKKLTDMK